jgi:C4-dicarboxylate-specific signal transduction histidine kinase
VSTSRIALASTAIALSATLLFYGERRAFAAAPEGVLILHSNQRPTPAQVVIEDTLRAVVPDGLKRPVRLYSEYLDSESASLERYAAQQAEFLRAKYGERNIRVIVADALPALEFATTFRDQFFPGLPIVHVAVARDRLDPTMLPANVVGNFEDLDPTPTLRLALRLHPDAKRLVLVRGASELDGLWDKRVRTAAGLLGSRLGVEYLAGLPTAEVLRRVGALSSAAIVFTPGYFFDGAGEVSTPRRAVERIAEASAVPVYGAFDTLLGGGIVGGYMTPYDAQAREAGAIVVRLLNGTAPKDIGSSSVTRIPMVDWRQLRHWSIDRQLLPPDTVVRFREPTAWDRYWREIAIAIAILSLQAGLIAALLFERRGRRRTASALEETRMQMSMATRAARLSLWIWDATRDKIVGTTHSWPRADPRWDKPITFEDLLAAAHPADREELRRAAGIALATGNALDVEYRLVGRDGDVRWVAARGRAEKGSDRRLLGVALDITERKTAELRAAQDRAALRHMTRVSMMGQLSAAIAHQLNQPLAAILGNAEAAQQMLGRGNVDVDELRSICSDIASEDQRAAEIIRSLSVLYKRGDGKIEDLDLNAIVRETLGLLRTELLTRHVTPVSDLAPELPSVQGEYVQLQQVLLNLVLNAADALGGTDVGKRRLEVRTRTNGADVQLFVIDNGSGIPPGKLKTVFDPFWSTKEGGTGMGLAICQSILGAHHGSITASNNEDGGATFCVSIPTRRVQ